MRGIEFETDSLRPVAAFQAAGELGRVRSRAFSPGYHRMGFQPEGLKARYVIARPGRPGRGSSESTMPCKGITGPTAHPDSKKIHVVAALQAARGLGWVPSRAFSPGYHRVGFQPESPERTISVLIHKPSIKEPEKFQSEKFPLYRYATRYLLERVSWFCRDQRIEGEGDCRADLIFSNRSIMSYEDLRSYLRLLKNQRWTYGLIGT